MKNKNLKKAVDTFFNTYIELNKLYKNEPKRKGPYISNPKDKSSTADLDLYSKIAGEFGLDRRVVKEIAWPIMYSPSYTGEPLIERVRNAVRLAITLNMKVK